MSGFNTVSRSFDNAGSTECSLGPHVVFYNPRPRKAVGSLLKPQLLFEGKYEILAKIREGGMGTIYKVRHRLLDEIRVVKIMRPHVVKDENLKKRFLEEARTAIRLKHPNLCAIYDFAADDSGTAYLVMEFIDGANLADLLKARGPINAPLTIEIGFQALLALGYLHRKGVIHRDVTPDNLMLTHDEDGDPIVKLIDLGIAKAVNRADMTGTGVFLGKLKYASPEQFGILPAGEKLDGRSDQYGLGVVLYELLTGIRPYRGDKPLELMRAHVAAKPIPFSDSDPDGRVPPALRPVILRALAKKREHRFDTAEDFARELVQLRGQFDTHRTREKTALLLASVRSTAPTAFDSVTPSAQDRLDRHFGPHATPSPSSLPLTLAPNELKDPGAFTVAIPSDTMESVRAKATPPAQTSIGDTTRGDSAPMLIAENLSSESATPNRFAQSPPNAPPAPVEIAPQVRAVIPPVTAPPSSLVQPIAEKDLASTPTPPSPVDIQVPTDWVKSRPRSPWVPFVVTATVAAAALLLWRPWAGSGQPEKAVVVAPSPAAPPPPAATERPAESIEPATIPVAAPTAAPAAAPASASPSLGAHELADASRTAAEAALQDADRVHAHDAAPTTYERAAERQATGAKLAEAGSDAAARKAFDDARELYFQAAVAARAEASRRATQAPAPARAPEPVAEPTPASSVPPDAIRVDDAATRQMLAQIEGVVNDYAVAQSAQSETLFAQVFPSGLSSFKGRLKTGKSRDVRIEVQSIRFEGPRAIVAAYETSVVQLKSGDEERKDVVLTLSLERRPDRWVIVKRE